MSRDKQKSIFDIIAGETPSGNVVVPEDNYGITGMTIETDSVSSCHFILIGGETEEQPFAYLCHDSFQYDQEPDARSTALRIIKKIIHDIYQITPQPQKVKLFITNIKIIRVIVAGGVSTGPDLIRSGLSLINAGKINISEDKQDESHLYKELQGKIFIIPSQTYLLSDEDEDLGEPK